MDYNTKQVIYLGIILIILLLVMSVIFEYTNWEYICTSPWRFSKSYVLPCVAKGYPLFP